MAPVPDNFQPFEILTDAYRFLWKEREDFLKLVMLPVVALAILGAVLMALLPGAGTLDQGMVDAAGKDQGGIRVGLADILQLLAVLVFYAMFAVAWYRRTLMPGGEGTVGSMLRWDARKMRFLIMFVAVFFITACFSFPLALLIGMAGLPEIIGMPVMVGVVAIVFGRLSLVFPAAALDRKMGLKDAWTFSKGKGWRLGLIMLLPPIPIAILDIMILLPLHGLLGGIGLGGTMTGDLVTGLVEHTLSFAGIAASVTALGFAYRKIVGSDGGPKLSITV